VLEKSILMTLVMAFLIASLLSPILIPFLRRLKFGQSIREEGPKSHQKKSGTPTMGGIMIILSIVVTTIVMTSKFQSPTMVTFLLLFVTIGYGIIGFLDDFIKVVMKRNLGLTSKQKLVGQLIVAIIFFYFLNKMGFSTYINIPGTHFSIDIGWLYIIMLFFILVGASNAVNLTDGLDGLLAGTAAIAFGAFAILAWHSSQYEIALFYIAVVF